MRIKQKTTNMMFEIICCSTRINIINIINSITLLFGWNRASNHFRPRPAPLDWEFHKDRLYMMETPLFFFHEERRECTWDLPPETTLENPNWPSSLSSSKKQGSSKEGNPTALESPTPISHAATLGGTTATEGADAVTHRPRAVDAVAPREGAFLGNGDAAANTDRNIDGSTAVVVASSPAAVGAASVAAGGGDAEASLLGVSGDGLRYRSTGVKVWLGLLVPFFRYCQDPCQCLQTTNLEPTHLMIFFSVSEAS